MKKKRQINKRKGFTIIEVILFLALTGVLLTAITGSIFASIHTQRYRDTTKDLSEFFRRAYSAVGNVENPREKAEGMSAYCSIASMWEGGTLSIDNPLGSLVSGSKDNPGRSDCVIYGKLVTWGEDRSATWEDEKKKTYLHMYDIIGRIYNGSEYKDFGTWMSFENPLQHVLADVISVRGKDICKLDAAGDSESYEPQWEGWLEEEDGGPAIGALLIFRSPISGTIETYYLPKDATGKARTVEVQKTLNAAAGTTATCSSPASLQQFYNYRDKGLNPLLGQFKQGDVYMCINSPDKRGQRRALKIKNNGNNASAVELTDDQESLEHCK